MASQANTRELPREAVCLNCGERYETRSNVYFYPWFCNITCAARFASQVAPFFTWSDADGCAIPDDNCQHSMIIALRNS